jgi:hypothetical protein
MILFNSEVEKLSGDGKEFQFVELISLSVQKQKKKKS